MPSNPLTWEEAASQAAKPLSETAHVYPEPLDFIDARIDNLWGEDAAVGAEAEAYLTMIADCALQRLQATVDGANRADTLGHVLTVIAGKQADYGHDNIAWGGMQGIVLRMHDKVARLRNLIYSEGVVNESIKDSWLDLVGYAIIGRMWLAGTFMLPLQRDLNKLQPTEAPQAPPGYVYLPGDDVFVRDQRTLQAKADMVPPTGWSPAAPIPDATGDSTNWQGKWAKPPAPPEALPPNPFPEPPLEYRDIAASLAELGRKDQYAIGGDITMTVWHSSEGTITRMERESGDYLDIFGCIAEGHEAIHFESGPNGFELRPDEMRVVLGILSGACQAVYGWRNFKISAEVPREQQ